MTKLHFPSHNHGVPSIHTCLQPELQSGEFSTSFRTHFSSVCAHDNEASWITNPQILEPWWWLNHANHRCLRYVESVKWYWITMMCEARPRGEVCVDVIRLEGVLQLLLHVRTQTMMMKRCRNPRIENAFPELFSISCFSLHEDCVGLLCVHWDALDVWT